MSYTPHGSHISEKPQARQSDSTQRGLSYTHVSQTQGVISSPQGLDTVLPLPQTTLTKLPMEKFVKGKGVVDPWEATLDVCTGVGGGEFSPGDSLSPERKPEVESMEAAAQASQGFG